MSRILKRSLLVLAVGAAGCVLVPGPVHAAGGGAPGNPLWALNSSECLALIEVEKVLSEDGTTNDNPPRLRIRVGEIIRGKVPAKRLDASLVPPSHDIDTGGDDNPELIAWKKMPLPPLEAGSKWIACLHFFNGQWSVGLHYKDTLEKREWVLDYLAKEKIYQRERLATLEIWPHNFKSHVRALDSEEKVNDLAIHLKGLQPETDQRKVKLGEPVVGSPLGRQRWKGHVVEIIGDKSVRIRPHEYDSRMDMTIPRENIELYPDWFLKTPPPLTGRPAEKQLPQLVRDAEIVLITKVDNTGAFQVGESLKGEMPKGRAFLLHPVPWDVSGLVDPTVKAYLILVNPTGKLLHGYPAYEVVGKGRAIFEANDALVGKARDEIAGARR